jgi:hypothetical protein
MIFKPADLPARWEGLAVCAWIAIVQLLLVQWIRQRTTDWLTFVLVTMLLISIPILLHVIYRTWVAFSLEYWVDRNAITVRWADVRQTIPLADVQALELPAEQTMPEWEDGRAPSLATGPSGVSDGGSVALAVRSARFWLNWPAHFVRPRLNDSGVALLATRPARDCVLLETASGGFALAPASLNDFADAVEERARMGPVANVAQVMERRFDPARLFSADRLGLTLVLLGLLGAILLFGALMIRFPGLPDFMAVRYNADGAPELVREKQGLFLLPAIGLMAWAVNGLWGALLAMRGQKAGSYLLWGGTLVVQVCAFFAIVGLIGWR